MGKICCLSFGICEKKFWLLLLCASILNIVLIILANIVSSIIINLDKNFNIQIKMMSYLFFENLCQSFMFIPYLISKKLNASKSTNDSSDAEKSLVSSIKYIFNKVDVIFSIK